MIFLIDGEEVDEKTFHKENYMEAGIHGTADTLITWDKTRNDLTNELIRRYHMSKLMGKVDKMTNADYHEHKALGSSTIKYAATSLAKFKAVLDGEIVIEQTDSMKLGSMAHKAILEKSVNGFQSDEMLVVNAALAYSQRAGKDAKNVRSTGEYKALKAEAEAKGQTILKEENFRKVKGMYEAFFSHKLAGKLIQGVEAETSYFTEIDGLYVKARPDYLVQGHEKGDYIVDFKTGRFADYGEFQKEIYNRRYDLQATHYIQCLSTASGRPISDYFWVVQETEAPFEIQIFRADPELLTRGTRRVRDLYEKIKSAGDTGNYPKRFEEVIIDIDLNHYTVTKEDENE